MDTFFCNKCGHATGQPEETEAGVFCPQCGAEMEREDFQQENVQQVTASFPELKRDQIEFNPVSATVSRNSGEQNISFKLGHRVRYDGQGMDKSGLKAGMEGEVVKCFQSGVDVYFNDLRRVVHLKDFHVRTALSRVLPETAAAKEGKKGERRRRIIRLFGLIASVILVVAVIIVIVKFKFPGILQGKYFLRYFKM